VSPPRTRRATTPSPSRPGADDYPTPAEDLSYAADRLLNSRASDAEPATVELLNYVAATWEKQDLPLRQHAQAVARALTR
jgi:hypothetical protein